MVNLPVFFTSAVASTASESSTPAHSFFPKPAFVAKASVMALLDMAETDFIFITFMAFTIAEEVGRK